MYSSPPNKHFIFFFIISRSSLILWTAGVTGSWSDLNHYLTISNEFFTLTMSWSEINEHSDLHWPLTSQQGGAFSLLSDSKRSHEAGNQTLMEPTLFSGQPAAVDPIRSSSQPCLSVRLSTRRTITQLCTFPQLRSVLESFSFLFWYLICNFTVLVKLFHCSDQ